MQWYGELPERWLLHRVSTQFSENTTSNESLDSDTPMQFRYGEIIRKKAAEKDDVFFNGIRRYTVIQPNDIMINGLNLNYDFVSQRVAIVREKGCMTPAYISMRPKDSINPFFACYLFKAMDGQKILHGFGTGIRLTLGFSELKKVYLPLPPRDEQDQIVRYLDWKVSLINKLISAKRRQIELLGEQRKQLISSSVMCTGADWKYTRLINLVDSVNAGAWGEDESGGGVNFDCIRVADFDFERLRVKDKTYTIRNYPQKTINKLALQNGDVLIEKSGGGDVQTVGRAVLYTGDKPVLYANFIEAVRPNNTITGAFLTYLLATQYYIQRNRFHFNQTTGIQNLDIKRYLRESMYIPPLSEQKSIVAHLDQQCANIDRIIAKLNEEITLFAEYRTRLISDTVTGKLDVRGVVVPDYEVVGDVAGDDGVDLDDDAEGAEDME